MLPGQFGLSCPFELIMRSLNKQSGSRLLPILQRVDIFRLTEDSDGNPVVGPRSALEAQLILRRLMGGSKSEIEYATKLLAQVRSSFITGQREIEFAVELLRHVGPNGFKAAYYADHFVTLADCLTKLRVDSGLKNVRLLLQESLLLREAGKKQSDFSKAHEALNRSIEVCREAIKLLDNRPANRLMRSQLLVEIAATHGSLAKLENVPVQRLAYVEQAHEHAFKAYSIDPTSEYPLDVIAWTANDILSLGSISEENRLRIIESVTHAFALADSEDWDTEAANRLDGRRVQLAGIVFGSEISNHAFESLLNRGSAAGVVLRAYRIAESNNQAGDNPSQAKARAEKALLFMADYADVIAKDPEGPVSSL